MCSSSIPSLRSIGFKIVNKNVYSNLLAKTYVYEHNFPRPLVLYVKEEKKLDQKSSMKKKRELNNNKKCIMYVFVNKQVYICIIQDGSFVGGHCCLVMNSLLQ